MLSNNAQGFADPRPTGRVDRRHIRKLFDRIGLLQIDSVNVVVRSEELPIFARLGAHSRDLVRQMEADGELFEGWAHEASLLPVAHEPLFRWKKERIRQGTGATIVYARSNMSLPLGVRKYQYWSNETKSFQELCSTWTQDSERAASPIVEKVSNIVATQGLTLGQIASVMGMSIATLQRRLREAGTSFREIAKSMRCKKMVSLLATDINFDDVAEELGLSERRSLWRICHESLGVSPSEYRRNHRCEILRLHAAR